MMSNNFFYVKCNFKEVDDFFIREERIFLNRQAVRRIRKRKYVCSKSISYFFSFMSGDTKFWCLENKNSDEFSRWSRIVSWWTEENEKILEEREENTRICRYINEQIGTKFNEQEISSKKLENILKEKEIPDGEEKDEAGESVFVIEIEKKNTKDRCFPYVNFQLQLATHLYLRNLTVGWICIYCEKDGSKNKWNPSGNLEKSQFDTNQIVSLLKTIPFFGKENFEYAFKVLKSYNDLNKTIFVYKIQIDMDRFSKIYKFAKNWISNCPHMSPSLKELEC